MITITPCALSVLLAISLTLIKINVNVILLNVLLAQLQDNAHHAIYSNILIQQPKPVLHVPIVLIVKNVAQLLLQLVLNAKRAAGLMVLLAHYVVMLVVIIIVLFVLE